MAIDVSIQENDALSELFSGWFCIVDGLNEFNKELEKNYANRPIQNNTREVAYIENNLCIILTQIIRQKQHGELIISQFQPFVRVDVQKIQNGHLQVYLGITKRNQFSLF